MDLGVVDVEVLCRIEEFLKSSKMPMTKFGRLAINDPRLVGDLRKGRKLRPETIARVGRFLASDRARGR